MPNAILLRLVLLLAGAAIMFLGLNIGLGGIFTLGWQMSQPFIEITDAAVFQLHDSHMRFVGGVWFGVGAVFFAGGFFPRRLRETLMILCAVIALAGLFRFGGSALLDSAILRSTVLELIGFPLLAFWLHRFGN